MRHKMSLVTFLLALIGMAVLCAPRTARAQADQQIYTDSIANGWQNWSWCGLDLSSKDYAHTGAYSAKIVYTAGYQGFYLHCDPMSTAGYTSVSFWINGGTANGRNLEISGIISNNSQGNVPLNPYISGGGVAANTWRLVTVPLAALSLDKTAAMTGFWIADYSGGPQPAFYVDDITLVSVNSPLPPQTINVDFKANQHAINPQVYGLAYASPDVLADLNVTLNRSGGNAATRYNWKQNASNHASDWFFESLAEGSNLPGDVVDGFIGGTRNAGAQSMITIPTLGWVAGLNPDRSKKWSFSQSKYGAQAGAEGDAGNGVKSNGQYVTGNDPTDANVASDSTFQQDWVKHIVGNFGLAAKGGLTYYILDNEPALWYTTHRDVHPTGAKISEVTNKIIDYAAKIKAVDSGALVVGPEEWGWSGYFYSGYDMQYGSQHGWGYLPDRAANGGWDAMPWMLNQLRQYDAGHNTKSLDVFSLHYYPQSGEYGNDISTVTQMRRNRSTRSLWDPNYIDESWIGTNVQLIPRMKSWVSTYYPGLKTALTEYSWGADGHINGATTQADVLGIFGREGLDMAARWTAPDPTTPTYQAIKMYRNVDGMGQGFGDISAADTAPDPDNVSSFAAVRSSDGAQTVMLINKALTSSAQVTVNLANCTSQGVGQVWQLTSTNIITRQNDLTLPEASAGSVSVNMILPAQSITLLAVPSKISPSAGSATFVGTDARTSGTWKGAYGKDGYNIINNAVNYPAYANVTAGGQAAYTWAANTSDTRALQKSAGTDRIASCWYSPNSFTVDVNLTDGNVHQVALYMLDWDNMSRAQTVSVIDGGSGALLGTQSVSSFNGGAYLVYNVRGHVKFLFTTTAGINKNAVMGGIFFDPQGGYSPSSTSGTVKFVKADTSTSGSWRGVYGSAGYTIANYGTSFPAYVTMGATGYSLFTWVASTPDTRALQKTTASDRIASCLYSSATFTVDVNITDGQAHNVSFYCLDWDKQPRTQRVEILDTVTGAVLDTQNVSGFSGGVYLVYTLSGHVKVRFVNTGGANKNAVMNGLFFD